jgi:hypothetical protein
MKMVTFAHLLPQLSPRGLVVEVLQAVDQVVVEEVLESWVIPKSPSRELGTLDEQ